MKRMRWIGSLVGMAVLAGVCSKAGADVYIPKGAQKATVAPVKSAEDAVAEIPVLSKIPRSFFVGDGFKFKLSGTELRIDHMATRSRAPVARRNCMISLNFVSPVAFFGSSMELPLVSSSNLGQGWDSTSLGDYVLHFSKEASVKNPTLGIKVTAHF